MNPHDKILYTTMQSLHPHFQIPNAPSVTYKQGIGKQNGYPVVLNVPYCMVLMLRVNIVRFMYFTVKKILHYC